MYRFLLLFLTISAMFSLPASAQKRFVIEAMYFGSDGKVIAQIESTMAPMQTADGRTILPITHNIFYGTPNRLVFQNATQKSRFNTNSLEGAWHIFDYKVLGTEMPVELSIGTTSATVSHDGKSTTFNRVSSKDIALFQDMLNRGQVEIIWEPSRQTLSNVLESMAIFVDDNNNAVRFEKRLFSKEHFLSFGKEKPVLIPERGLRNSSPGGSTLITDSEDNTLVISRKEGKIVKAAYTPARTGVPIFLNALMLPAGKVALRTLDGSELPKVVTPLEVLYKDDYEPKAPSAPLKLKVLSGTAACKTNLSQEEDPAVPSSSKKEEGFMSKVKKLFSR